MTEVHSPIIIGITERGDPAFDDGWKNRDVDLYILVTKAPNRLPEDLPARTVIHCTITGNGSTWLEPNVPPVQDTISAYRHLIGKYGPNRVVLRVDPIVPQGECWDRSLNVVRQVEGRLRISFIDAYDHVRWRIRRAGHDLAEIFPWDGFHAPLDLRRRRLDEIQTIASCKGISVEICGEPGLASEGCTSAKDLMAVGLESYSVVDPKRKPRPACTCKSKVELLNHLAPKPCGHGCLYCYYRD